MEADVRAMTKTRTATGMVPANLYQYLAAVCACEEPEGGVGWFVCQFPAHVRAKVQGEMNSFLCAVDEAGLTDELRHDWPTDFYLTRNGHGAGFWDGDYPDEVGRKLTDIAHGFGETWAYKAHGRIYIDGGR